MNRKGILNSSAHEEVCPSHLIKQGLDEKNLAAKRPPILSLASKAYLKAPNRHQFGIHGIPNAPLSREPEIIRPKRKTRVRFSRFTSQKSVAYDEEERWTPRIILYSGMSLRDRWDLAQELNHFKRSEMLVHPASIQNTTFVEAPSLTAIRREMEAHKKQLTGEMLEACRLVKGSPDLQAEDIIQSLEDDFKSLQVQSAMTTEKRRKSGHCRRNAVLGLSSLLDG